MSGDGLFNFSDLYKDTGSIDWADDEDENLYANLPEQTAKTNSKLTNNNTLSIKPKSPKSTENVPHFNPNFQYKKAGSGSKKVDTAPVSPKKPKTPSQPHSPKSPSNKQANKLSAMFNEIGDMRKASPTTSPSTSPRDFSKAPIIKPSRSSPDLDTPYSTQDWRSVSPTNTKTTSATLDWRNAMREPEKDFKVK
eukprot:NODE_6110_length_925_cov_24.901496_g5519_i0.p1 GENE.NODE_6110_length_925_cov_24.901496_g5519_i0~~NODE_6110_length_925_cov_24.901496_g5519_i0.p1  ORF type:complete len:194 (-),score=34.49 NODE_6110_length_925_cov_24.901496_g5519_i0:298-879(-)